MHYEKLRNLDRTNLPLNGPGNYCIKDGKVNTRAIEINALRECNLSCRSCSHSSPIAHSKVYDIEVLKKDLEKISQYLNVEFVRLVGGEPLLHPNLLEILKTIKNSHIGSKTCLVTNGLLLNRLTDEMLEYIDKIEISLYFLNNSKIKEQALNLSSKNVKVRILEYSDFRESIVLNKSDNLELIQDIYDTCQIAHNWRCITLDNGYLYRCPQSMIYAEKSSNFKDALNIDNLTLENLLNFLENNNHLEACHSCLGSVGKKFKHEQIKKEVWEKYLPQTLEDGVDREYMEELKVKKYINDCQTRKRIN